LVTSGAIAGVAAVLVAMFRLSPALATVLATLLILVVLIARGRY
jgi:hypothetical protein